MCGIAGFIDSRTAPDIRTAAVGRMCAAMVHRGPDEGGSGSWGEATLGIRRLAIFDPANGHQPMRAPDDRFAIVFNGSIVNHPELRRELAGGWEFRTACDTEVLLAAFVRWGERCLERLRGMYAFAVWDALEGRLFIARCPFGIKPLYYRHEGGRLLFASELNGLLASGFGPADIDPVAVSDYLAWFAVPAPRTIYRGVRSLRPGECATFRDGRLELRRFWSFGGVSPEIRRCASRAEFTRELRVRLEDTIRAHTLADVPLGVFLSGGVDSSTVLGLMARAGTRPLRTFSVVFTEQAYSEAAAAEATARYFGAEHCASVVTGADAAGAIDDFVASLDQPTGDGLNTYYASRAARSGGVTVALSGLGGDELFGGYPSFRDVPRLATWLPRWRRLPERLRVAAIGFIQSGDTRRRKLADFLTYAGNIQELCALQRRVFAEAGRRSLLGPEVLSATGGASPFHPELDWLRATTAGADPREIAGAWELCTYMTDQLLRDSDVMSMRHSIELRVPFVDRPLIEWLWRQPAGYKFNRRHPKDALAKAVEDILPPGVRTRRKHGFTMPLGAWMKAELRPFLEETFSDASVGCRGLFRRPAVQERWRDFLKSDDPREWSRVWSLAMIIAFLNRRGPAAAPVGAARPIHVLTERDGASPFRGRRPPDAPAAPGKRFLLLAPELFSSNGGIPRILRTYLLALSDLAARTGGFVRLVTLNDAELDPATLGRYANGNLERWRVCGKRKNRFVREALRLGRGCDTLVCGHLAQLPVAWLVRQIHPSLRYYLVAHGLEVWRPFTPVEKIALRGAEGIFCISEYTRRELLGHCPLPEGRAIVLPNVLDPHFEIGPGRPLRECPPSILSVTRLNRDDRYKGVEHLILAMPAIVAAEPSASLRIVGTGDDVSRLQQLARTHGLLDRTVEFVGAVDDERLVEELRSCRLFALPSRKEGFGLVFLEAMAHGRPCLGVRAGGIPEVITPETGLLVEFGDVGGIAQGCLEALRRDWPQDPILDRARSFSYEVFKNRLAAILSP